MDLPIGTYHTIIPINSTYLPRYSTHHKHKAVSVISVRAALPKDDEWSFFQFKFDKEEK